MIEVQFFDSIDHKNLKYAVIAGQYNGKWVLCKHKERSTYEFPGGHREKDETILDAAKRELYEETGAIEFDITPICVYKVHDYGMLYYANIRKFDKLPDFEMEQIYFMDAFPSNLTYPLIHTALFKKTVEFLENKNMVY